MIGERKRKAPSTDWAWMGPGLRSSRRTALGGFVGPPLEDLEPEDLEVEDLESDEFEPEDLVS